MSWVIELLFIIWWTFALILVIQVITGDSLTPLPQMLALISSLLMSYVIMYRKDEVKEFNQLLKRSISMKLLFIITLLTIIFTTVVYVIKLLR